MEIVKIRMQTAGEINRALAKSERTMKIVKELGFFGLYKVNVHHRVSVTYFCLQNNKEKLLKGVKACLLRDIPFSMIYFPSYSHMKKVLADDNGHNSPMSLFYAGLIGNFRHSRRSKLKTQTK